MLDEIQDSFNKCMQTLYVDPVAGTSMYELENEIIMTERRYLVSLIDTYTVFVQKKTAKASL